MLVKKAREIRVRGRKGVDTRRHCSSLLADSLALYFLTILPH